MSSQERRDQLLDTVARIVVEEGYGAVSIDRVAREAGIVRTVVYSHFNDLEGMLHALVARTMDRAMVHIRSAIPDLETDQDPDDVLVDGIRAFTEAVQADPATFRLALLPADGARLEVRAAVTAAREAAVALIRPLVDWGIVQRGGPLAIDVELFTRSLIVLFEDAARLVLSDPQLYPPERIATYAATLLAAIERSPRL